MSDDEDPDELEESDELPARRSGYTGTWSVAGSIVPVWKDKEEPPPLVDSDKHDPLPAFLEKLGLRLAPPEEQES